VFYYPFQDNRIANSAENQSKAASKTSQNKKEKRTRKKGYCFINYFPVLPLATPVAWQSAQNLG
jgi:hypothetical protein